MKKYTIVQPSNEDFSQRIIKVDADNYIVDDGGRLIVFIGTHPTNRRDILTIERGSWELIVEADMSFDGREAVIGEG